MDQPDLVRTNVGLNPGCQSHKQGWKNNPVAVVDCNKSTTEIQKIPITCSSCVENDDLLQMIIYSIVYNSSSL